MELSSADASDPVRFLELEVSLNCISPVLNCKLPAIFGSGIRKVPSTLPVASVINLLPAIGVATSEKDELVGVTCALTSTLSKNAYSLVLGLK